MIEVQNVTKYYGQVRALDHVSFDVKQGELVGLLGPNGSGKTTLMRILTGFFPPTEGKVRVAGLDVETASLEVRRRLGYLPENVVLYATSNRRHIVRERFGDRVGSDDDVHVMDTMEEKLSLSDRFGIRLRFGSPDQTRYLEIARGIARRRGVALSDDELNRRALAWAQREKGRSGRTDRQFVDALVGELAMP